MKNEQPIWKSEISLDILNARNANTMVSHLGIEMTEVGANYLMGRMPVDDRTKQPIGIMHGGASCVLAETVGSNAANYAVDLSVQYCVGLDINTNHIRQATSGYVYGKAMPLHLGRSTQVWSIEITNEQGKLVSINRLTMAVMQRT